MAYKNIAGVRIDVTDKADAKSRLRGYLREKSGKRVFTPNSVILGKAARDVRLRELLNKADLLLPDGIGVALAFRIKGYGACDRITGIDTAEWVLRYAAKNGLSVYLLGGEPGVAERAARRLKKALPTLKIAGTHHGYFDFRTQKNAEVLKSIRSSNTDIVFVCMGFPRQEAWINRYAPQLSDVRLFMGLGGSLDVWSGKIRRAPSLFRAAGLEWLWRALREPRRTTELLSIPIFLIKQTKS